MQVPVTLDPYTGEELLTAQAVEIIETTKARYMGLLLPHEIREMRERLGVTPKRMAELLQMGKQTYTLWESGRARPSRTVNVLLRLIFEGKVSLAVLEELRKPRPGSSSRSSTKRSVRHEGIPIHQKPDYSSLQPAEMTDAGLHESPAAI